MPNDIDMTSAGAENDGASASPSKAKRGGGIQKPTGRQGVGVGSKNRRNVPAGAHLEALMAGADPAGKRPRTNRADVMDADVMDAEVTVVPPSHQAPPNVDSSARNVQSRDETGQMNHAHDSHSEDEFDLDTPDLDELSKLMREMEIKHGRIKELAEQRLRIAEPIDADKNKWRVIPPSQFEKENGHWPTAADYDARTLMVTDKNGALMSKTDYYRSLMANCKTSAERNEVGRGFVEEMEKLGASSQSFVGYKQASANERTRSTPDGTRESTRVSLHPLQSGQDLPNLHITHANGEQTIEYRNPDHRDMRLTSLQEKYGAGNVALRDMDGGFRTGEAIGKDRETNAYKLAPTAEQLYKSYAGDREARQIGYGRVNESFWVEVKPGSPQPAAAGRTQLLLTNPKTGAHLGPGEVSRLTRDRPEVFDGKSYREVLGASGINPDRMNSPPSPVPDVLIKASSATLVGADKFARVAPDRPLTEKFDKSAVLLQNYGNRRNAAGKAEFGPTGNYSTLEYRERQIRNTFNERPPAEQYARLYHGLQPSQQAQLRLPEPDQSYNYLRSRVATPARPDISTTQRDGLSGTQPLTPARQMSRPSESLGR